MLLRPIAVPAHFILLAKVTWLKEKPNASPSGSEKKGGGTHSGLRNENVPMPPSDVTQRYRRRSAVGSARGGLRARGQHAAAATGPVTAGWAWGARAPVPLSRGAPEVSQWVAEQSPSKLGMPSEQRGICQHCCPALLWRCKARVGGNASSFIGTAGNRRLPERKRSDTFPLPHIFPFSSTTTESSALWIKTAMYKANDNAEQNYSSDQ